MKRYGHRPYLKIDSVPKQNNEKSEGFFEFLKGLTLRSRIDGGGGGLNKRGGGGGGKIPKI